MMRGTVYQVATEPLENGAIAYRATIETLDVGSAEDFRAMISRSKAAPGIVLEFGPIAPPWRRVYGRS